MRKLRLRRYQGVPGRSSHLLFFPRLGSGAIGTLGACACSFVALHELPSQGQIFLSAPENEAMFSLSHRTLLPSVQIQLHFLIYMDPWLRPFGT